jgi:hypothetical protein
MTLPFINEERVPFDVLSPLVGSEMCNLGDRQRSGGARINHLAERLESPSPEARESGGPIRLRAHCGLMHKPACGSLIEIFSYDPGAALNTGDKSARQRQPIFRDNRSGSPGDTPGHRPELCRILKRYTFQLGVGARPKQDSRTAYEAPAGAPRG